MSEQEQSKPKRKGCLTLVAALTIILLVSAGLSIYFYGPDLNPNRYRTQLKQIFEQRLNAEVNIGLIMPIVYPGLGIELRDFEVKYKPGPDRQSEDFVKAKSLKAVVNLSSLIRDKCVVWDEIILDKPVIRLRREANRKLAMGNIFKPAPEKPESDPGSEPENPDSQTLEDQDSITTILKDFCIKQLPEPGQRLDALLNLEKLVVKDARFVFVDQAQPKRAFKVPLDLSHIDLTVQGISLDTAGTFKFELPFPQSKSDRGTNLELIGSIEIDVDARKVSLGGISGSWGRTQIHGADFIISRPEKKTRATLDIDATADMSQLRRILVWPPIHRSDLVNVIDSKGRGRIKAHMEFPDKSRASKMRYRGVAQISNVYFDPGRVTGPLDNVSVKIDLQDAKLVMPETSLTIGGIPISGSCVMTEAKNPSFYINAWANEVDFGKLFYKRPRKGPPPEKLKATRTIWAGKSKIKSGKFEKMHAQDIEGEWSVIERELSFKNLKLKGCQGTFVDTGTWANFNHPTDITLHAEGHIRGMDVTQFVDEVMDNTIFIKGTFDGDGWIQGIFRGGDFQVDTLDGELDVTVHDGRLVGYNFIIKLINAIGAKVDEQKYYQPFEKITVTARLKDGVAYFDNFYAKNWNLVAQAAGSVNFINETVDLKLAIYPLESLSTLTRPLPLIGELINLSEDTFGGQYYTAKGDWDEPLVEAYFPIREKFPKRSKPLQRLPLLDKLEIPKIPYRRELDEKQD